MHHIFRTRLKDAELRLKVPGGPLTQPCKLLISEEPAHPAWSKAFPEAPSKDPVLYLKWLVPYPKLPGHLLEVDKGGGEQQVQVLEQVEDGAEEPCGNGPAVDREHRPGRQWGAS